MKKQGQNDIFRKHLFLKNGSIWDQIGSFFNLFVFNMYVLDL